MSVPACEAVVETVVTSRYPDSNPVEFDGVKSENGKVDVLSLVMKAGA